MNGKTAKALKRLAWGTGKDLTRQKRATKEIWNECSQENKAALRQEIGRLFGKPGTPKVRTSDG